jgi:hypothetical protein
VVCRPFFIVRLSGFAPAGFQQGRRCQGKDEQRRGFRGRGRFSGRNWYLDGGAAEQRSYDSTRINFRPNIAGEEQHIRVVVRGDSTDRIDNIVFLKFGIVRLDVVCGENEIIGRIGGNVGIQADNESGNVGGLQGVIDLVTIEEFVRERIGPWEIAGRINGVINVTIKMR